MTLAAVYDVAKCLRAKHVFPVPTGEAEEEARASFLERLDSAGGAAAELDTRWKDGLQRLCEGEASTKWAEHVVTLASVAQLHKGHVEAVFLFRLAEPAYHARHAESAAAMESGAAEDVAAQAAAIELALEMAELANSLGESLLELRHHGPAGEAFKLAHAQAATSPL